MSKTEVHDVPSSLTAWMQPFRDTFTAPTWRLALVLVMGAILVPGRRTVASALRIMGLGQISNFTKFHRVLNGARWSARWLSRRLLEQLVDAFVPPGEPVVIGGDDSIERRWGGMIKARGIYRDPVRSSRSHVVKASGLRWLSLMLLPEIRWAGRCWALPFLTLLAPSRRYWDTHKKDKREYKKLTDWARQGLIQTALWLPHRRIIAVTDSSFAAIKLLNDVRPWVTMITRLRLDAALSDPPRPRKPGQRGRSRVVGRRDLAVSYEKVGDVLVAQGNLPEALKFYRDSLAIRDRLAKSDLGNAGWQRDLAVSYDKVGDVLVAQGHLPEALKFYRDSLAIADQLAKSDPGNAGWQRDLAVSYAKLAVLLQEMGASAEALTALRQGQAIIVRMTQISLDNAVWENALVWFNGQIAQMK
jgi:tetratricopeptide (TPR) repeat protein